MQVDSCQTLINDPVLQSHTEVSDAQEEVQINTRENSPQNIPDSLPQTGDLENKASEESNTLPTTDDLSGICDEGPSERNIPTMEELKELQNYDPSEISLEELKEISCDQCQVLRTIVFSNGN